MMTLATVAIIDEGCFSAMLWNGVPFAVGLERTFEGSRVVIPGRRTTCTRSKYHKGGYETFEIAVAGHNRVLFHKGNVEENSEACVLVGESFEPFNGKPGIAQSGKGFEEFMKLTAGLQSFELEVLYR